MTPAQTKLDRLLASPGGGRRAERESGISIRALRDLRDGAKPQPKTRRALAKLGIALGDWSPAAKPMDLDLAALERELPADRDDLLARLVRLYEDPEVSISDRARAASIALSLARGMPSRAPMAGLEALAADLLAVDRSLKTLCNRHLEAARAVPENPAAAVLEWASREARRPGAPERTSVLAYGLEARARRVVHELVGEAADGLSGLAADVVKLRSPVPAIIVSVLERHGQEARPLAHGQFNVTGHRYAALCLENGWRPRLVNPPRIRGADGFDRPAD